MPKTLIDLAASLGAYLGCLSALYLLLANYEKLQENYIITVAFIVAIVVVFCLAYNLKILGINFWWRTPVKTQ